MAKNFNLTKEDLVFLMDLQNEMLTQDHVCQAAPRFWVVAGTKKVYASKEYAEGEQLIQDSEVIADGLEEAVKYFQEQIEEEADDEDEICIIIEKEDTQSFTSYRVAKIDKSIDTNAEDYGEQDEIIMEQNSIADIEELLEALSDARFINKNDYDIGYYCNEDYRYPNTMFLTNRSCKEHIKANHYHYSSDAHSYAMTAWRSPEVEKLWTILEKIDFKAIKDAMDEELDEPLLTKEE